MKLDSLDVRRLPGISAPFRLEDLGPGINVVVGPNASGKTSLVRAVRATLWPEEGGWQGAEVVSEWTDDVGGLRAVLDGGAVWQRAGVDIDAPSAPGPSGCRILGMADLLQMSGDDDDLVDTVRVQMAGGYDLPAVRREWDESPRAGRKEQREHLEMGTKLQAVQKTHDALAASEDSLTSLQEELKAARSAQRLADAASGERQRLKLTDDLAAARGAVAAFDEGLSKLTSGDLEAFQTADRGLAARRIEVAGLEKEHQAALTEAAALALPDAIEEAEVKASLDQARRLVELRKEATRAQLDFEALPEPGKPPDPSKLDDLEALASDAWEAQERRARLQAKLSGLPDTKGDPDVLAEAVHSLRGWLREGSGKTASGVHKTWPPGAALVAVGIVAALLWLPLGMFLLGAGAGWLAGTHPWGPEPVRAPGRQRWRDGFPETGVDPPKPWEPPTVTIRLRELEGEERRARAAAERPEVELVLADVEAQLSDLDRRREELAEDLDGDAGWLRLMAAADGLRRAADATEAHEKASKRAQRYAEEFQDALGELDGWLRNAGEERGATEPDEAFHRVEALLDRLREARSSLSQAEKAEQERLKRADDEQRLRADRSAVLERAGIAADHGEPEAALASMLALKPEYDSALAQQREIEVRLRALPDQDDSLAGLSAEELERREAELRRQADGYEDLVKRISDVEAALGQASKARALEDAIARRHSAALALERSRSKHLHVVAGAFLLDDAASSHEQADRPAVAKRAAELFRRFTRNSFKLRPIETSGDGGDLGAIDTASGQGLSFSELSDGTRMQLLLAARMAFAIDNEGDSPPLPLFLDEALTASDSGRFAAVAEALIDLTEVGRQVFYLTSNPGDVGRWRAVCEARNAPLNVIDLAEIRRIDGAMDATDLTPPTRTEIPAPNGQVAADYGALLRVPAPDPWQPDALHLFHLLRDDLPLLHRLLTQGRVETVGAWKTLHEAGVATDVISDEAATKVQIRCAIWEAVVRQWQVGRGRPATREALEDSGAVSDSFLDRLASLLSDQGGDAAALLRIIEQGGDERTKGFRTAKLEELRDHLTATHHLDDRERSDEPALRSAALRALSAAPAATSNPTPMTPGDTQGLLDTLLPPLLP